MLGIIKFRVTLGTYILSFANVVPSNAITGYLQSIAAGFTGVGLPPA